MIHKVMFICLSQKFLVRSRFIMSKKILKYDDEQMQQALLAVKQNNVSVKSAAKQFNVPKTTLHYKVTGKYPEKRRMGPKTNLLEEEENIIIDWMFKSADRGFPITKSQLLDSVEMYIKNLNRKTSFKGGKPGEKWFKLFMRRHPEVARRMTQNLGRARASITEESLKKWFDEVKTEFKEHVDIFEDPSRVFNTDETAIFLAPKGEKALVRKGEKAVYSFTSNDEKECLTCLIGSNALGQLMPPMVVFKYERVPSVIINELPNRWSFGRTESGWMTSESFFEYIANIFHTWLVTQNIKLPVVLFVDGHSSHLTYSLSEFCSHNGMYLVALHPNATHVIQPMDVAVFRPLKEHWRQAVHSFKIKNSGAKLKRENFAPLMDSVLQQLKSESFVNGFRRCGLFPFDKNAVNYGKYFKKNIFEPNVQEHVSKEMLRIHFKFLQARIGADKVTTFEKNVQDIGDASLYLLWKKLKEECDLETNIVNNREVCLLEELENDRTRIGESDNNTEEINSFEVTHIQGLEENRAFDETEDPESLGNKQQSELENNTLDDITNKQVTPTKDNEPSCHYTTNNQLPSPFKNFFILPQKLKVGKKRQLKEIMPSVISGEKGKEYFRKKEEERDRKEREKHEKRQKREEAKLLKERGKEERKQKLEEKKQTRLNQMAERQKNKRKHITASESSDSSIEMTIESEDEGGNWDQPLSDHSETQDESGDDEISDKDNLKEEDFVIIIYDNEYYPGQIKNIDPIKKTYLVKTMVQSGFNFRWPEKEDLLWYSWEDIKAKIEKPKPINSRGSYYVSEMKSYMK